MRIKLSLFIILILLISCSKSNTYKEFNDLTFEDFKLKKTLTGNIDSLIMRPSSLKVIDSLLIVVEPSMNRLFSIFNLKSNKLVGKRIDKGQGPKDMIMPKIISYNDSIIKIIDMATFTIFEYDKDSFINIEDPTPINRVRLESPIFVDAEILGNNIVGYFDDNQYQLKISDIEGRDINHIAEYPPINIPLTNIEKKETFYMSFATNGVDKIAICYYMTDLIEIYNIDGNLEKRLYGPEQFVSIAKSNINAENIILTSQKDQRRDAFFAPEGSENMFFTLFNGGFLSDPNHSSSCKLLFSLSWNGEPQAIYTLDDPIFSFTIDSNNKKIYGISNTPEYHIVEYKLD